MAYEIETGIPLPSKVARSKPTAFPLNNMDVGDSFKAPSKEEQRLAGRIARYIAKEGGANLNKRFVSFKIDKRTLRCWRTV